MIKRGVTIGTFDGVHAGHRLVVEHLISECGCRGLSPLIVTFKPHPLEIVAPSKAPKLLVSEDEKLSRLQSLGAEVLMMDFNRTLAAMSSVEYMRMLRDEYQADMIALGYDNRFGHENRADFDYYRKGGESLGLSVSVYDELPGISSSIIRHKISAGEVEEAARMLTCPHFIEGIVIHGNELGRTIGFPTANLSLCDSRIIIPANGVYAAIASPEGERRQYPAMVNIGTRPTVSDSGRLSMEANLIGFGDDLYGKKLRLDFISRIRPERKMHSLEELKSALASDRQKTLDICAEYQSEKDR